ncbi:thiol:disulfide interchange protein DsbA/DsbL [Endozoicomonadaceae bacterium StTr2]
MRQSFARLVFLFSLLLPAAMSVQAAEDAAFKEGVHFRKLSSSQQDANAPIEVKEIFWYGCPHCFRLEPFLEDWTKELSQDVKFVRSPGVFRRDTIWENHARLFFALQSIGGLSDEAHADIFQEIQVRKNRLKTPDDMADFLKKYGVDGQKFKKAYASFGVQRQIQKTMTNVRRYGLTGVPALVVAGKYVIEPRGAGSVENMLTIADYLIEKENSQRKQAAQ